MDMSRCLNDIEKLRFDCKHILQERVDYLMACPNKGGLTADWLFAVSEFIGRVELARQLELITRSEHRSYYEIVDSLTGARRDCLNIVD